MISKELLSKVLGYEVKEVLGMLENSANKTILSYIFEDASLNEGKRIINIYELANKCKEWALNKGYRLLSGFDEKEYEDSPNVEYSCIVNHIYCEGGCRSDNNFNSYSEPEAIFKACQWILENK